MEAKLLRSFLLLFFQITCISHSQAEPLVQSVAINAHYIPPPQDLKIDAHGNFLLAGGDSVRGPAWAIKIGPSGQVLWKIERSANQTASSDASSSGFHSIALLPNDRMALCGHLGSKRFQPQAGNVSIVSSEGEIVDSYDLFPKNDKAYIRNDVDKCIATEQGLYLIGSAIKYSASNQANNIQYFYWIALLDKSGRIEWEIVEPTNLNRALKVNSATILLGNDLVICASASGTEVIRVSASGQLKSRAELPGEYMLIYGNHRDSNVYLISTVARQHWHLVTLDDRLVKKDDLDSDSEEKMAVKVAWWSNDEIIYAICQNYENFASHSAFLVSFDSRLKSFTNVISPSASHVDYLYPLTFDEKHNLFATLLQRPWAGNEDSELITIKH